MKFQVVSDLHLEAWRDGGRNVVDSIERAADVLVVAGDLMPLTDTEAIATRLSWLCDRFARVLYVAGNHEFYGTSGPDGLARLAEVAPRFSNLTCLDRTVLELDGVRIVAASLWFPYRTGEELLRPFLSDFRTIDGAVPWIHEQHAKQLEFLRNEVRKGDVVITHHVPHERSVAPQWKGDPLNRFFVVPEAAPLVEERGAAVWIHGHTHEAFDYVVGTTRVVCNPHGYPGERGGRYPTCVVEVEPA